MAKYSENMQGFQKQYKWGNIFKTPFDVDLPFNT